MKNIFWREVMGKKKKKKVVLTQENKGYSKKEKHKGHQKNNRGRGEGDNYSPKKENITSADHMYLADYARSLTHRAKRPFSLKYFGKAFDESKLSQYEFEIKKARWLSNPKNTPKLIALCDQHLHNVFGPDATTNYSVPSGYRKKDLPTDEPSREAEEYVFTYSDEMRDAFIKAKKFPITEWAVRSNTHTAKIETRQFLFNVDGQVLVGELTVETSKAYDAVQRGAKSGIKFSMYYRGREEAKFTLERWDYEPLSQHLNKFDKEGYFQTDGVKAPNTTHSHVHKGLLHDRVTLTQNQSYDIYPTPINSTLSKGTPEHRYETFDAMVTDFMKEMNMSVVPIPNNLLDRHNLKKVGRMVCPEYSTELRDEIPAQVDIEQPLKASLAPNTYIRNDGQVTICVDAFVKGDNRHKPYADQEQEGNEVVEPAEEQTSKKQQPAEGQITLPLEQGGDGGRAQ